jgi:amidophosphoribosyltransferase
VLDPVHDECGVAAVYRTDGPLPGATPGDLLPPETNVVRMLPDMLIDLQNRGQLAAGITRYNENAEQLIDTKKGVGIVSDVFHLTLPSPAKFLGIMKKYAGRAGIGHTRYATCGRDDPSYAQPFEVHDGRPWKWFAFCFNGNVANYTALRALLEERGYHLVRKTDTELLMHNICYALSRGDSKPEFERVFSLLAERVDGAYSLAFLNADGDLVLARDPYGFRPLCYAMKGNLFAAASESIALKNRGFEEIHDLEPGMLIHVTRHGLRKARFARAQRTSFCFFEQVYFANVASNLGGHSVYLTRTRLGEALADSEELETDPRDCVAVPVPDTAKAACDGMAYRLGIPSREGLIRNRYVGRTFIEGNNRRERVMRKFSAIPEVLEGKRVFLVEDSIVRATTLRVIVKMLREQGRAREIHVRVSCPPIMAPCSYGIDMSTIGELFVPRILDWEPGAELTPEASAKLAAELGADSLRYLTIPQLVEAMHMGENELCLGCLVGKYPTEWGNKVYERALKAKDDPRAGRAYEDDKADDKADLTEVTTTAAAQPPAR